MKAIYWVAVAVGLLAGCAPPRSAAPLTKVTAADVVKIVREPGARVVLVNMWATWCVPCREEFPDIVKLERAYRARGLRVVFVSWDAEPETARKFLVKQGVDYPSSIKDTGESDTRFVETVEPRWSGQFPATMIYDNTGTVREFWEGSRSYAEFEKAVVNVLNTQPTGDQK